ncbi:glycosyltransferase family 4 protein [Macellibacteroides fermentans]|uniref:glycosyltransferase family 4 protein n=1 Tax=Macellibacteroides fermentans TaxID=879969 RepID=UPI00406C9813
MIKVLFTTNLPSPYRLNFFNELSKHVDLTVFFFYQKGEDNRPWNYNSKNYQFKYKVLEEFKLKRIRFNPKLYSEINKEKFDFIIIGGYSLISEVLLIQYCKRKNLCYAINSDGGFINNRNIILEHFKKNLILSSKYWLSSGRKCTETLLHYGAIKANIYEYKFSSMWRNEILSEPLNNFQKELQKEKLSLSSDVKIILTVGQYINRKGIDIFLECANKLQDKKYLFLTVGQGPLKEKYIEYIQSNHLENVIIKDYMNKLELIEYFKAADLFLFPTREDIWGLVINEAISFGLPIIVSEHAGAAYDLIEGNGLITSLNSDEIVCSIREVLENEELANSFSKASIEIAKNYTIEAMVREHLNLIYSATSKLEGKWHENCTN